MDILDKKDIYLLHKARKNIIFQLVSNTTQGLICAVPQSQFSLEGKYIIIQENTSSYYSLMSWTPEPCPNSNLNKNNLLTIIWFHINIFQSRVSVGPSNIRSLVYTTGLFLAEMNHLAFSISVFWFWLM